MAHGNIHWSELISADVEGSKKFFTEICGWTINAMPMPNGEYNVCMVGEQPVAGIMGVEQIEADHEIPPHWMTYIEGADVDVPSKLSVSRAEVDGYAGRSKVHAFVRMIARRFHPHGGIGLDS